MGYSLLLVKVNLQGWEDVSFNKKKQFENRKQRVKGIVEYSGKFY